ncbi:MAG: hypothetical protein ACRDQZ_11855, partial [Mycobacteriales bacterium]
MKWIPWKLAPDSDPKERFILVSEDGETEHPDGRKYDTIVEAEYAASVAMVRQIAQWWTMQSEQFRKDALSDIPGCLAYGLVKTNLPERATTRV